MAGFQTKHNRQMRRFNLGVIGLFVVSIVAICGLSAYLVINSLQGERREPKTNILGVKVDTLVELEGDKAYPESLTIGPDGNIYAGSFCTGELWRITPDGEIETFIKKDSGIGAVSGMAFSPDGSLYVVDRVDCDPRKSTSKLKKIAADGTISDFGKVTEDEILNSLVFTPDGLLYATDTQLSEVRVYTPDGQGQTWWEVPEQGTDDARPTGLAYDEANNALLVADSSSGTIFRVSITPEGEPGEVTELYHQSQHELDGLTLDDSGNLIFTIYDSGEVAMLETNGTFTILAENFREPSDVAYQDGRIYVTNFDPVSLAPVVGFLIDPSLPFTIDIIDITEFEAARQ